MNKDYFIGLMNSRRMSMRGLAQRMGMQHSQLSLTLNGQRKLQLEEAAQLSQIFGVPLHQIAVNTGINVRPTSGRRTQVIGFVGKDGAVVLNPPEMIERAEAPEDLPDDTVAVQFRTAESPLSWCDGWVAFFRRTEGIDPEAIGRTSFVKIRDGEHAIATVTRGYQPGTYNLSGIMSRQNVPLEHASPVLVVRP
jgi:transcriptional regulator with XRE-family HTH domain